MGEVAPQVESVGTKGGLLSYQVALQVSKLLRWLEGCTSHSIRTIEGSIAAASLTCGMLTPFRTHFVSGIPEPLDHGLYQTIPNAPAVRQLLMSHNHPNAAP